MNSEIKEIQDANQKDTLAEMVRKKFGASWNKFKTSNRSRLAKMADVSEEEYLRAQTKDNKKNIEYNLKIRDRILKNNLLPLHKDNEIMNQFEQGQQNVLKETFTEKQITAYMSNISEQQIILLKKLSPIQLVGFMEQEMIGIEKKKNQIQENMGFKINNETSEQLANLTRLSGLQNRLSNFLDKNNFSEHKINKLTRRFEKDVFEKEFQGKLIECKGKKVEYEKLIKVYGSEQGAEEYLRYEYSLDKTKKSDSYAQLAPEQQAEFEKILVDSYVMNQELDIDVSVFGFESLSSDASEIILNTYNQNDPYMKLMTKINSDSDIATFFDKDDNKLTELVPEKDKNKEYYSKLLSFYPESNSMVENKKLSEYLQYFDDDMNVKNDTPSDKKNILSLVMKNFKQQQKPYEDKLLHMTNAQTQTTAVEKCVSTLQMYVDIDINQKENITKQLEMKDTSDVVSKDLVLHIDGTIENGTKKVQLSYDLVSGKVSYKSFLAKKANNDQTPITIDSSNSEDEVPLVTLPTFGAFVDGAKNIDYKQLIKDSSNIDQYYAHFKTKLQQSVRFNNAETMNCKQDILKKVIIKDMIFQNIIMLTGRNTSGVENLNYTITESQPESYAFYNYLYKSLEYYSMRSINQLQDFQNTINTLIKYRQEPRISQTSETLLQRKGENQEMFALQSITNRIIIPNATNLLSDQGPEINLQSFFKCFEKQIGGMGIIDIEMMSDYLKAAEGTNSNTVGKWKRTNNGFTNLLNNLDTKISGNQANQYLDTQLQLT